MFSPDQQRCPFRTVELAVQATGRHVEGLANPKGARLPLPGQREFARHNKTTGVKGMGVGLSGDIGQSRPRVDIEIALLFPVRFNLWGSDSPKLASLAPRMLSSLV